MLAHEVELKELEQHNLLLRWRNATLGPKDKSNKDKNEIPQAAGSAPTFQRGGNRLKLREPGTFKGKTLKEDRKFVPSLELIFALSVDSY